MTQQYNLGIDTELQLVFWKRRAVPMCIAALQRGLGNNQMSISRQMDKEKCCIHTMEYYLSFKKERNLCHL